MKQTVFIISEMEEWIDKYRILVYYSTMTVIQRIFMIIWLDTSEHNIGNKEETMEYNPALPIYLQVANSIKRDIVTGKLEPGTKLPSVRELAVIYTVNPNTVSRVYKELEMEDVCFTRRGMGTFVTMDPEKVRTMKREMAGSLIYEFLEGMRQLGFSQEEAIKILEQSEYREKKGK